MSMSPIRLLVVEDNEADALLLKHTLAEAKEESFQVVHVETMAAWKPSPAAARSLEKLSSSRRTTQAPR